MSSTTKPAGKMGKAAKEKKEIQSCFLELLEQEDDPIDLQFNAMAGRVKQELPSSERYTVALQLMGHLNDYIIKYKRQQTVATTFLNPGPQAVSVPQSVRPAAPPPLTPRMPVQPQQVQTTTVMTPLLPLLQEDELMERQYNFDEI